MNLDTIASAENLVRRIREAAELSGLSKNEKRLSELELMMQEPDFWSDRNKATTVSREFEGLKSEIGEWKDLIARSVSLFELAEVLTASPDQSLESEWQLDFTALTNLFSKKEFTSLFSGRHDRSGAIVSVYAGSGGTEAQDWASMVRRMLFRFAEKKGWKTELIDESLGEPAGIKSSIFRVSGLFAYGHLKSEHGTHRLVRISPFDAESMRHTSFAGVEVIPEIENDTELEIKPEEIRMDVFMAGGKGGQSVNTTYSAVRIVHLPTGIVVQCQNERSQLQNREQAMRILRSKLEVLKEEEEERERLGLRGEHKSAEWGNQIRSYVLHPYKMVKDLRTRHVSKDPDSVLSGELDEFVEAYVRWDKAGRPDMKALAKDSDQDEDL